MANYNVGNIEIGILTNSPNTLSDIDKTISKLQEFKHIDKTIQSVFRSINQLGNGLKKIQNLDFNIINSKIDGIVSSTKTLVAELSKIDQPNFGDTAKSLNQLGNAFRQFDKLKDFDFKEMYNSFEKINQIITPFLQKLKDSETSLQSFATILKKLTPRQITKINTELNNTKKISNGIDLGKLFNLGKIYFFINYSKRFVNMLSGVVSKAIDFNEVLNKFQVSMGSTYEKSLKFVNDITKAFNISTESIMDYMSTFKNMLSALGNLSEDTSYQLSETLTRMALDYASLFNVEVNRAMEQFQSVLSGQIRSIRSVSGYDVSENSIYNIYKSLGGTKTMRQLDQIEKRLLRIIALQQQMESTGAVGDFAKTINETANQLKQLQETFKEIGRWIGQLTMVYMQPLIENLLSMAIAIRNILEQLNIAKGYEYKDFGKGGLFGDIEDSANGTLKAVNELKKELLGFDKLNILGESNTTSEASDYIFLIEKIKEYETLVGDITNEANIKAEQFMEKIMPIVEIIQLVFDILKPIWEIVKELKPLLDVIFESLATILIPILTSVSTIIDAIEPVLSVIVQVVGSSLGTIVGVLAMIVEIGWDIITIFGGELLAIIGGSLFSGFEVLKGVILTIVELVKGMINAFSSLFSGDFSGFINAFKSMGEKIKEIWEGIGDKIKSILKNIVNLVSSGLGKFVNGFIDAINNLTSTLSGAWEWLGIPAIPAIPEWNPPMLASGGVIKQPTMAMVGEYKGASSNPEIVTPENLMREVFMESMLPIAQAIVSGDSRVVEAIQDLANRPIEMNGRKLSETIYSDLEDVAFRKGKTLAFSQ